MLFGFDRIISKFRYGFKLIKCFWKSYQNVFKEFKLCGSSTCLMSWIAFQLQRTHSIWLILSFWFIEFVEIRPLFGTNQLILTNEVINKTFHGFKCQIGLQISWAEHVNNQELYQRIPLVAYYKARNFQQCSKFED